MTTDTSTFHMSVTDFGSVASQYLHNIFFLKKKALVNFLVGVGIRCLHVPAYNFP